MVRPANLQEGSPQVGEPQDQDHTQDAQDQENRRVSYAIREPNSAPELIKFINCKSPAEIKALTQKELLFAAIQGQNTIEEWEDTIYRHLQTIEDLKAELRAKEAVLQYLELRPGPVAGRDLPQPTAKEIEVTVPEFENNTSPTFENWKALIEGKFEVNSQRFPTERSKIVFLFGKTKGDAQIHLSARYHSAEGFATAQEMIDLLATVYVNPHKVQNARTDFKKLYMRNLSFHEFYTKFLHLAGEGNIPIEDYHSELYNKLAIDLQKAVLPTYGSLTTYKLLADQCLLLDRELKRIKERTDRHQNQNQSGRQTTNMARNSQNPIKIQVPANQNSTARPINLAFAPQATTGPQAATSFMNRPRPVYDDPHRQALSRAGACFKCHEVGHRARECPQNLQVIKYQAENQGNVSP
jgi:hypothetical protein